MRYAIVKNGRTIYTVNSRVLADAYAREFGAHVSPRLSYLAKQVIMYYVIVAIGCVLMSLVWGI